MSHRLGIKQKNTSPTAEEIGVVDVAPKETSGQGLALDDRSRVHYHNLKTPPTAGDLLQYVGDPTNNTGRWTPVTFPLTADAATGDLIQFNGTSWEVTTFGTLAAGDMIQWNGTDWEETTMSSLAANEHMRWNGTDWVNDSPVSQTYYHAAATASLALTTSDVLIPGCSFSVTTSGIYHVTAVADLEVIADGTGALTGTVRETIVGTDAGNQMVLGPGTSGDLVRATVAHSSIWDITATKTLAVRARKAIDAGTGKAHPTHSTITAVRIGYT